MTSIAGVMLCHFVRTGPWSWTATGQWARRLCSAAWTSGVADPLLQLCVDRYFISPGPANTERFCRGMRCSYGPLGTELRRNLLEQWWHSVGRSSAQVFGIDSVSSSGDGAGPLRIVESETLTRLLDRQEPAGNEQLVQEAVLLLQKAPTVRTNSLQGALEQFVPAFELVNRKLPFGLAEAGPCFQPSDGSGCPAEVTQTSLVWFCSPRTSSQWLDHWTRQRLKWWRKFALSPSHFSSSEVPEEELIEVASRGVKILYSFPWGQEALETLWSRGDTELLHTHEGVHAKLQCRDGRKSIPHVVSLTGNMDRGVLAFLSNSFQQLKPDDSKRNLLQRKVLKLHPALTPVKVALNISRGATLELRQVCEGLLQEFQEVKISTWRGYLETLPTSMEKLNVKYDEMGVLFTVVVGENTLENGLLQVRSRDTTIKETMHISEIRKFLSRYISAADSN